MKFYSEVTEKMYDTVNALYKAEEEAEAERQNGVEEAAKELKAAVEKLAREAAEYEKKAKEKEQEAIELEKEFMNKYGADAFKTHLLIPALQNSMSDLADAIGIRVRECPSGNDLKDAISKFLDK